MDRYREIEEQCIQHLEVDYMPLNDIVREFTGLDKILPTEEEFLKSLEYLEYFINKHDIKCLEGPSMNLVNKFSKELIHFLKQKWYSNEYNLINYGIWFDI